MNHVAADTVKYPEWIADDCRDADLGTVLDAWRRERRAANALDDVSKFPSNSLGDHRAGVGSVVGRDVREVSNRFSRPDDLHSRRNFAKASATSASVATSP